jgi:hypothetical protein
MRRFFRLFAGEHEVATGMRLTGAGMPLCGGMHPPFLFFAKKRNGPCTVQRENACAAKWPLAIWRQKRGCSETVRLGLRFAGPSIVSYRVRRTLVEQRWFSTAS